MADVARVLVSGGNVRSRPVSRAAANRFTRWLMLISGAVLTLVGCGLFVWFERYLSGLTAVTTAASVRVVFDRSLSTFLVICGMGSFGVGVMNLLTAVPAFMFKKINIFNVQGFLLLPAVVIAFAVFIPATVQESAVTTRLEDTAGQHLGIAHISKYDTLGDDANGNPITSKVFTVTNTAGDKVRLQVVNKDIATGYLVSFTLVK